jgi:hypothetical protein
LHAKINVQIVGICRQLAKVKNDVIIVFTQNRAVSSFRNEPSNFKDVRQAAAVGLYAALKGKKVIITEQGGAGVMGLGTLTLNDYYHQKGGEFRHEKFGTFPAVKGYTPRQWVFSILEYHEAAPEESSDEENAEDSNENSDIVSVP